MTKLCLAAAVAALVGGAVPAPAQDAAGPERSRVRVRAGAALAGTGRQATCTSAPSLVGGIEVRTAGRAFLSLGADLHVGMPIACDQPAVTVDYGDARYADDDAGTVLLLAPRVGVRAGAEAAVGRLRVEPSLGGGLVLSSELEGGPASLRPWASAAVGVPLPRIPWELHLEAGTHATPVTHEIFRGTAWQATRRFQRWEPLFQLTLRRGL